MKKRNSIKRIIALTLVVLLIFGMVPLTAAASTPVSWNSNTPPILVGNDYTITLSGTPSGTLAIPTGATVNITGVVAVDLGFWDSIILNMGGAGATVNWTAQVNNHSVTQTVNVLGAGTFYMSDGFITNTSDGSVALQISDGITLNVNSGTIGTTGNNSTSIQTTGAANVNINDGTISATGSNSLVIWADATTNLSITGGTVIGDILIGATTYFVVTLAAGTDATGGGLHAQGSTVNITAGTPPTGQVFSHWSASPAVTFDDADSPNTSFTMPNSAVTATAHWATPPTITAYNAAPGRVGDSYGFTFVATGNPAPTFLHAGTLPPGLTLSSAGVLSGTPTEAGTFNFTIVATNSAGTDDRAVTIVINQAPTMTVYNAPGGTVNTAYSFTFEAIGSPTPTFSHTGTLPPGLTLSSAGVLSGVPTTTGTFNFNVMATNFIGTDAALAITVMISNHPVTGGAIAATAPVRNEPVASATATLPNTTTGAITWTHPDGAAGANFGASRVYTAVFTLTADTGFNFNGLAADTLTVAGATSVTHPAVVTGNQVTVTVVFPTTAAAPITSGAVTATAPVRNEAVASATATLPNTSTGTIAWTHSGGTAAGTNFRASRVYTAVFTLTADPGFNFNGLSADTLTVAGATSVTHPAVVTGNTVEVTVAFPATAAAPSGDFPFVDVPQGHWAREYAEFVWEQGIMQGVSDTLFAPNTTLSRAMAATILWRTAGEPTASGGAVFTDVASGRWYSEAIAWANENGIVLGVGGNRFNPTADVTRQEFAAMMFRYAAFTGGNTDIPAEFDLSRFQDRDQLSGWAERYLYWANYNELITGRAPATLAPQGTATRAEAAGIVYRFVAAFG
ncbi:MAG: S-layer homology domain-containing protein [Oscillospiraceae bacterium]|nr:S-layer homology domain-containing protein [Oscillospiraceae bacterium]